jgi:hypothetical protein
MGGIVGAFGAAHGEPEVERAGEAIVEAPARESAL